MINCIVVDDEPWARQLIVSYINQVTELSCLGAYSSPIEALADLNSLSIDIMFLDIDMPDINGIDFVRSVRNIPKVIFITAHAEFAVQAFEIEAIDYLVKPVSFDRFLKSIQKVIPHGKRNQAELKPATATSIFIKVDKRLMKVNYASIEYIEAMGDYLKIHTVDTALVTYMPVTKMESLLPSSNFIRIHRSTIINIDFIQYIEGNFVVISGEQLPIGLTFRDELLKRLNS